MNVERIGQGLEDLSHNLRATSQLKRWGPHLYPCKKTNTQLNFMRMQGVFGSSHACYCFHKIYNMLYKYQKSKVLHPPLNNTKLKSTLKPNCTMAVTSYNNAFAEITNYSETLHVPTLQLFPTCSLPIPQFAHKY